MPSTEERLDAIEAKLDKVLVFTSSLEKLLAAYLGGGKAKLLAALVKVKG